MEPRGFGVFFRKKEVSWLRHSTHFSDTSACSIPPLGGPSTSPCRPGPSGRAELMVATPFGPHGFHLVSCPLDGICGIQCALRRLLSPICSVVSCCRELPTISRTCSPRRGPPLWRQRSTCRARSRPGMSRQRPLPGCGGVGRLGRFRVELPRSRALRLLKDVDWRSSPGPCSSLVVNWNRRRQHPGCSPNPDCPNHDQNKATEP